MKSFIANLRLQREKFKPPRTVQQALPIREVWPGGIFKVGNQYSKTYCFTDINYSISSKEDKTAMFLDYCELLNSLDSGVSAKITVNNRRMEKAEFERSLLIPLQEDALDKYRVEYNNMLLAQVTGETNSIVQERYLTVSIVKPNITEARAYFSRIGTLLIARFAQLSSYAQELSTEKRLRFFRDFFKQGGGCEAMQSPTESASHSAVSRSEMRPNGSKPQQANIPCDLEQFRRRGHSFKDWIAPSTFEFATDHFKMGDKFGRVLFLMDYASYIKDSMITELCELGRTLMLSIDILPVPTDEAVRETQNRLLSMETNATNWLRKQMANNNFSATLPYDMEMQRKETKEFLDDLTTRDQRMMMGLVTMVHVADTKEQLNADTDTILSVARKHLCEMDVLKWQQREGLDTVLPYGARKIEHLRTLTTESTAVLIPFKAQEIMHAGGIYYGINAVSKNLIVADRRTLQNGHSFRLGVSGSGKSFSAKEEITFIALSTDDDILILDPESEFSALAKAFGGEVIPISATSEQHLNALDMDKAYGDGTNPLIEKSEFLLSMFEQLVGAGNLSPQEKSILDRVTAEVYRPYMDTDFTGEAPTLKDFHAELQRQPETEAKNLALAAELFVSGSLNTFAQQTDVDTKNRIIVYDIRELGKQLMPLGMLVTLDAIFNRVIRNWKAGKRTWIFADEFYLLFRYEYSADFFYKLWKRLRKYNGFITGLTQNVDELLRSDTARLMLANSEFLVMLNQAATDRAELAKLLGISGNQLSFITNVPFGHGLIRCSGNLVPFQNEFPMDTKLYKLMSTKPGETFGEDIDAGA